MMMLNSLCSVFTVLVLALPYQACASSSRTNQSRVLNDEKDFIPFVKTTCDKSNPDDYSIRGRAGNCRTACMGKSWCQGYERTWSKDNEQCILFRVVPRPGERRNGVTCYQAGNSSPTFSPTSISSDYPPSDSDDNWNFLVVADLHTFTPFSWRNIEESKRTQQWRGFSKVVRHMKENYGGDFVMIPGDLVSYGPINTQSIVERIGGTPEEAVYKAGMNSHTATRELFRDAGYNTIMATIGDHDLGGNEGFRRLDDEKTKLPTLPLYRKAFGDGLNRDEIDEFIFDQSFGNVPSRPLGTTYQDTSYAHVHKNALFITVDAFEQKGDGRNDYLDRENGRGGEGAITCTVSGDHLKWFEKILIKARDNPAIKHIFVQAHLPIIQPVRKVSCSGQFFDSADTSDFFRLMEKFDVDIYFAGEVHANTVTKSRNANSNLIQIVSRGVAANNFLSVRIYDTAIHVKVFNEIGDKRKWNAQYVEAGHVIVDKSFPNTKISSGGTLELLDVNSKLIAFDFEEIFPLGSRQVPGLNGENSLMSTAVTIRNHICSESMYNIGNFGSQYDAQICNIRLVEGRNGSNAGLFDDDSRLGIFGTGPYSGGEVISFGLWIKTSETSKKMVLVHYANYWGTFPPSLAPKDHITLTLDLGTPILHTQPIIGIRPSEQVNLADGGWHHIAISMPWKSCKISEIKMYIDGRMVETLVDGEDRRIFTTTSGRMSLGGYGYSDSGFEYAYPGSSPYNGLMDDFQLYARPLNMFTDFPSLFEFVKSRNKSCDRSNLKPSEYEVMQRPDKCNLQCLMYQWCHGYERTWDGSDQCTLFKSIPVLGERRSNTVCAQKVF